MRASRLLLESRFRSESLRASRVRRRLGAELGVRRWAPGRVRIGSRHSGRMLDITAERDRVQRLGRRGYRR